MPFLVMVAFITFTSVYHYSENSKPFSATPFSFVDVSLINSSYQNSFHGGPERGSQNDSLLYSHPGTHPPNSITLTKGLNDTEIVRVNCSNEAFQKYFRTYREFPEEGQWRDSPLNFHPSFCEFTATSIPKCLVAKNVKSILFLGDSQAKRYSDNFLGILKPDLLPLRCKVIRSERQTERKPQISYFATGGNTKLKERMVVSAHRCSGCTGAVSICPLSSFTTGGPHSLKVEYVTMELLNDTSISLSAPTVHESDANPPVNATTFPEFLFRVYLQNTGYPDIIFIFLPMNHIKHLGPKVVLKGHLKKVIDLIKATRNDSTQIYFITAPAESEYKRKSDTYRNRKYEGLLATPKIYVLNRAAYEVLETDLLDAESGFHGFINLVNVSQPKIDWNTDGVHYQGQWYRTVVEDLMWTLCSRSN